MREVVVKELWSYPVKGCQGVAVASLQISPESMHSDNATIADQQKELGYESVFV